MVAQGEPEPDSSTAGPVPPSATVKPPPPAVAPAAPSGGVTVGQLADLWPQIRNDVKAVNRRIEALLASIDPIAVSGANITLAAAYDFHRKRMNEDEVRGVVEDAISRVVGQRVTILCVLRGEEPPAAVEAPVSAPTRAAEAAAAPTQVNANEAAPVYAAIENGAHGTPEPPAEIDTASEIEQDQQRLQAAKNIFDAEEVPS